MTTKGTGTGTGTLHDSRTNPATTPVVRPIVKAMVAEYIQADIGMNWKLLEYAQQCCKSCAGIGDVKKTIKDELIMHYGKEEGAKRAYYFNRALSIAYTLKEEDIAAKKTEGLTFNQIYELVRSPQTRTVAKQQTEATSKDNDKAPKKKKGEESTSYTAPTVKADDEKTQEEIIAMLETYFDNSKLKMKLLVQAMMVGNSRFKSAVIEAFKEQES